MSLFGSPRYADGDRIVVDGAAVRLKVSGRARRVSLRLDTARREVVATAPSPRRLGEAAAFALERRAWITARLAELPQAAPPLAPGMLIEVLGETCRLEQAPGRPRWRGDEDGQPRRLVVSGQGEAYARAVVRALKAEARRVLTERTEAWARVLDRPTPVLAITDARGRVRRGGRGGTDSLFLATGAGPLSGDGLCRRARMRSPDRGQPFAPVLGGGARPGRRSPSASRVAPRQRLAPARVRARLV